jgi:type IV secretory pathway TraG/TraD family ATPase VirD4/type II secretory pathway pseudopilin PulG
MSTRIATAEWADPALVEEKYLYRDGTVWLGRSASEHPVPVGYSDDRHVCVVSGSRGGKGTTSIVNNLILWPGSICVVDPKGENATVTAARRGRGSKNCRGLGQAVKVLDPFKASQVDDSLRGRFNPLDALDPASDESIDEAGRIADAVVVIHESNDPFWDESARSMVKGLLLHVLTAPEYEGRRNLVTVRKLIMRGDWEAVDALRSAGETDIPPAHGLLWTALANNRAFDDLIAGIGDSFTNMLLNSPKQFESVLQVANRNTEFIDSPPMQRCLEASDFQLSELKTLSTGLSIYLCLPQRYMSTHYRWLRMMIALTVTEMEKVRGQPVTGYPVLMVLDEFAGLKRMEVIEYAVAQIASYGVKLFFVLQSLEQLKAVYKDNWETFLANSGLKVFFNLEDHFSREYVSKLIGETEVIREVRSESDSTSESDSVSRSTSRSQSQSRGRSSSTGTSENEGTNSSVSTGKSWGANWGESRSHNRSYAQGWIFRNYDRQHIGDGRSQSTGRSITQNKGQSHGVSHGTSRSRTDGTSETLGTSTSETEGMTHGTSTSRTAGSSETIQKRALITPDEIGQVFSRVDERSDRAYPGLALVVISGARPVPLRRVNYYEDFQFMQMFEPHPDYPFVGPKELTVEAGAMGVSLADFGLRISGWSIKPSQLVAAGDEAAVVTAVNGMKAACIRVPRAGLIEGVPGSAAGDVPAGPLFSELYYEDGAASVDPFAELRTFCNQVRGSVAEKQRQLAAKEKSARLVVRTAVVLACVLIVVLAISLIRNQIAKADKAEKAAAAQQAAEQAAKDAERAKMTAALFNKYGVKPKTAENAGTNTTDPQKGSDTSPAGSAPPPVAIMIGKIDVSHFAGLKAGDTVAQVASVYGSTGGSLSSENGIQGFDKPRRLLVSYHNGGAEGVALYSDELEFARSHVGNDPLFDLFGRSEADAVEILGAPTGRDTNNGNDLLYWYFPSTDTKDHGGADLVQMQHKVLALSFKPDYGCDFIKVNW